MQWKIEPQVTSVYMQDTCSWEKHGIHLASWSSPGEQPKQAEGWQKLNEKGEGKEEQAQWEL